MKPSSTRDLREACVAEAFAIVGEVGVEGLSIREVARRLGVSHQAPYKHFPSSEHLLAEIARRTYRIFAEYLEARPRHKNPAQDMGSLGEAYVRFALEHPAHYRLIFGSPLPDAEKHPEMMAEARQSFAILQEAMMRAQGLEPGVPQPQNQLDALFVWATVHGLATIMQTAAMRKSGIPPHVLQAALPHTLECIGRALGVAAPAAANETAQKAD